MVQSLATKRTTPQLNASTTTQKSTKSIVTALKT